MIAFFVVYDTFTMALPVVSKAGAKVDIKCLGDVYGVLNGDKDRSNLGRGVKTFTTFLHLESEIITIINNNFDRN